MASADRQAAPRWTDWVLRSGLALFAAALRLWAIGRTGIAHFDAASYAISSMAVARGDLPQGLFPMPQFYAPPLYFGLGGIVEKLTGLAADRTLILISVAFGVLSVVLLYDIGRAAAGRGAGLAAGILLATSDFHILYSRTALTDVTFLALFLLAIRCLMLTSERASFSFAVAAGVATGLAWNTKYHGWLAGVVAGGTLIPLLLTRDLGRAWKLTQRLLLAGLIAGLLYLPWFLWVQAQPGGNHRLLAEHVQFFHPARFAGQALAQLRIQLYLDGWWSRIGPALALGSAWLLGRGEGRTDRILALLAMASLAVAGVGLGGIVIALLLLPLGAARLVRRGTTPAWYVLSFFALFTVLTPLYHPYPRLLLPWIAGVYLLAGAGVDSIAAWCREHLTGPARPRFFMATGAVAGTGLMVATLAWHPVPWTYRPNHGFQDAARRLESELPDSQPLPVLGEPALVYYLREQGYPADHLGPGLKGIQRRLATGDSVTLIAGIYCRRTRALARWEKQTPGTASEIARVPVAVNDVRLLNDFDPTGARAYRAGQRGAYDLQVVKIHETTKSRSGVSPLLSSP